MRPEILNYLFCQLDKLPGIGEKKLKAYQRLIFSKRKLLEDNTIPKIIDLLYHLPDRIQVRKKINSVFDANTGDFIIAKVKVLNHMRPDTPKRPYQINCFLGNDIVNIVYYKYYESYLLTKFKENTELYVSGKFEKYNDQYQIIHPDFITKNINEIPTFEPIYPLTFDISNRDIIKNIDIILKNIQELPEWINKDIMEKNNWLSWKKSLLMLHKPIINFDEKNNKFIQRIAFDELLAKQLALKIVKKNVNLRKEKLENNEKKLQQFFINNVVKFKLTGDQEKVLKEIENDTFSDKKMMRLLQGDVGSGKTIVAFLSMLNYIENNGQCVLMVPTSILATQHYEKLKEMCNIEYNNKIISVALLTGKVKGKKRDEILKQLKDGDIDILIGTHALIEDNVEFKDLRFVVIDEQHRFGVKQRLVLVNKSQNADILSMTATPIPRSLALTLYNDMDLSVIHEKPTNRKEVISSAISMDKYEELISKLKNIIDTTNEKIFWICPLVEETENIDLSNVEDKFKEFCGIFGDDKVAFIHGKMKEKEKDAIMEDFCKKDTTKRILIATTVIEVGIDIPEATLIIIEHPERFGLSQLHQLRGRVGRGDKQSYCIFLYNSSKMGANSFKRMSIMKNTTDGFKISEEDLKMRGIGEVLGLKQSGDDEYFVADLDRDFSLFELAMEESERIIKNNELKQYILLLYLFDYVDFIKNREVLN